MWGDWATRCLAYKDSRTPFKTLMAYFLMGSVVGFGTLNQPKPKYMTNPQTAQDFTRRCEAHIQKTAWQQAFKDCNKAISLNDAPSKAYFGRSAVRRHYFKDFASSEADFAKGQRLILEQNKKIRAQVLRQERNP